VSGSSPSQARYVGEDTSLTNNSGNKLTQVTFTVAIPSGFEFVNDHLGACTAASGTVTCLHGLVVDGQKVANTLVFKTPTVAAETPPSTFAGKWCWDGCDSHNAGATRVDSIGVAEGTSVVSQVGFDATYLPAGKEASLATGTAVSATDTLVGTWTIQDQLSDLPATATEAQSLQGVQACPAPYKLCRKGNWFAALSPGTAAFTPYATVVYTQDKSLIPAGTTESNYRVVYTHCDDDGCDQPTLLDSCAADQENKNNCTESVTKLPGGGYRVRVRILAENGYMH
jgi:hypothetical protein